MIIQPLFKRYLVILFTLVMLMTCWEYNASHRALAEGIIPQESIRLRILAHSDEPREQWIKRKIRDEIVMYMRTWVQGADDITEARTAVAAHLPAFEQLVGDTLRKYGFKHDYSVELGIVDFPAKIYGSELYPAGDYEALKVVLGAGKGLNWWCVLFPPLCFVDIVTSKTVPAEEGTDPEIRFFVWDAMKSVGSWLGGLFK